MSDKNNYFEILENNKKAKIYLSKSIYSKDVIVQTTYVLLDKFYFLIDVDNEKYIVNIWPKEKGQIEQNDIFSFLDELIESASYIDQLKRTKQLREILLEKALLSQTLKDDLEEI